MDKHAHKHFALLYKIALLPLLIW